MYQIKIEQEIITFDFYNDYAKFAGFGAKKCKNLKNQQRRICERQNLRLSCDCLARFVVRFVAYIEKWHVPLFVESHNHDCLDLKKITEVDAGQITNMKKASISTLRIYVLLANQVGDYENVNYTLRDMYNKIVRQRRHVIS
ncbi:hypothetical protein Ahy_B03g061933 [Arachis hypogaea]|uniref:FAR1 domain-containing protein n=1 Tax=Arachis hypogaea TaxID=3818 RepID=A0A444ZSL2_ARAHY|nr:hypothetical protein Ahy_B03g061933 [Arachis hypogaea]